MEDYYEINRRTWNLKTPVHLHSKFYDVPAFKLGQSSLQEIELQEVGNVEGKSLIHLQCHFGLDTLSWARLGADVTGVDISDESIGTAQALAEELKIKARFVRANVYDIPTVINDRFDIVFTSYGALNWLDDLNKWAEIVSSLLKPGGAFHIVEFHPFAFTLGDKFNIEDSYFNNVGPVESTASNTYTGGHTDIPHQNIEWNHSLGEVINALINNGLTIKYLNEFPYQVYDCFPHMKEIEPGKWVFNDVGKLIPYMYSLKAVKE
jgi:SAM-dependent methyltransferase